MTGDNSMFTVRIWSGSEFFDLDTAPAPVRERIVVRVHAGRASGRLTVDGKTYRWGDLRADNGQPILDRRAYRDGHAPSDFPPRDGNDPGKSPEWTRVTTGC
jgi:hypothetical protein